MVFFTLILFLFLTLKWVPVFTKKTRITGKTTKYRKDHKILFNDMYFRVFPLVLIFQSILRENNVYRVDRCRNFSKSMFGLSCTNMGRPAGETRLYLHWQNEIPERPLANATDVYTHLLFKDVRCQ